MSFRFPFFFLVFALLGATLNVQADDKSPSEENPAKSSVTSALPRSTPEAQGVSSAGIRAYVEAADRQVSTMHSFMLVRHGHVIAEGWWKPEAADKLHVMHSLSKSFTSTAVGLAIEEGKLNLDDPVLKFFPEDAPAQPSENLKAMTVRDLLTMSCGHEDEVTFTESEPWVKSFLAHPVPFKPGTHFKYNTPGTHMLSAIVTRVTGQTVLDYLRPRLFEPLGIENPEWPASPQGNTLGGWGLRVRTEDVAKFGLLYLQKGKWNGKQRVPASWVEQATRKQVSNAPEEDPDDTSELATGVRIPVLALYPRVLPGRRRQRAVLHRVAGVGRRGGDHGRHARYAGGTSSGLGPAPARLSEGCATRECRGTGPAQTDSRRSVGVRGAARHQ
jgi:CubicO group peptidase (beta-lactamase class C family)